MLGLLFQSVLWPLIHWMGGFSVFVPGKPATQGSKRSFGNGIMVETCKHLKPWRADVKAVVAAALPVNWDRQGPKAVLITIKHPRPKSHFNSKGEIKLHSPRCCTGRVGDVDKNARAILDSMADIAYNDDAQVVWLMIEKVYAEKDEQRGASITIAPLPSSWYDKTESEA